MRTEEHVVGLQKVARPDFAGMVSQERGPALPMRSARPGCAYVPLDRAFADFDPELEQFSADSFRPPRRVVGRHRANQRAGLGGEALCGARSAPPAPQGPEAGAMPAKKRLGLDDAQRIPPRRRQGRERDQHDPVESGHPRPGDRPLQNGDLVAQLGDLREQRPSRPKQVDDSGGELVMTANMVR